MTLKNATMMVLTPYFIDFLRLLYRLVFTVQKDDLTSSLVKLFLFQNQRQLVMIFYIQ